MFIGARTNLENRFLPLLRLGLVLPTFSGNSLGRLADNWLPPRVSPNFLQLGREHERFRVVMVGCFAASYLPAVAAIKLIVGLTQ